MRKRRGFALVLILGLVAIAGALAASSLHEALFGQALAGTRQLQQRAGGVADIGMATALALLAATPPPEDYARELQPLAATPDTVVVTQRSLGSTALAAGYSGGHFVMRHYEVEAQGRGARGTRVVQVQGVQRILPAPGDEVVP